MLRSVRRYSGSATSLTTGVALLFAASTMGTNRRLSAGTLTVANGWGSARGNISFDAVSSPTTPRGSRTTCHRRPGVSREFGTRNCALDDVYAGIAPRANAVTAVSLYTTAPVELSRRSTTCIGVVLGGVA